MTSVHAFTNMMDEFLKELKETFPEERKISVYYNSFKTMRKVNPRAIVDGFMMHASPCSQMIMNKDESYFLNSDDDFINELNVKQWWTSDLSTNTKDAIWQYINTLLILGTTITAIPENMLSTLESVAEQCATQMESTGDQKDLLANMQNMLGSFMNQQKK